MKINPYVFLDFAQKVLRDDSLTAHGKDVALAGILSQMEYVFDIPALYNAQWASKHLDVFAVYCTIGNMRTL